MAIQTRIATTTTQPLSIRTFVGGERPVEFWQAMGPMFASKEIRKDLPSLYDNPNVTWFLGYVGEKLVAFASVEVDAKGVGHLRNLYVSHDHRNSGYASALMDARILYLRRLGVTIAQTTRRVSKEIHFAEHHGFAVAKVEGGYQILRATLEPIIEPHRTPEQEEAFKAGYDAATKRLLTSKKRVQKLRAPQAEYQKWSALPLWEHFCAGWTSRLKEKMGEIETWSDGEEESDPA